MYRNYVFDLYGTLVDIRTDEEEGQVWEKLRLFLGFYGAVYQAEELKEAYERLVRSFEAEDRRGSGVRNHEVFPEIQIERVFRALFAEKGVEPEEPLVIHAGQLFRVLSIKYVRLYEGARQLLEELKKREKRIFLLSNAQRIFTEYEMRLLDIEKYFDGILISSDYGVKKPDRRFFELLLEKFGLDAKECVMIGNDGMCDVAGAKGVGMDTCYIHSNLSPEESGAEADFVAEEMDMERVAKMILK